MSPLPKLDLPFVPQGYATPCSTADPEQWFPEAGSAEKVERHMAIAICGTCPLIKACDEYAQERPYLYGVWGGRSKKERGIERGVTTEQNLDPWGIEEYVTQARTVPAYIESTGVFQ